MFLVLLFTSSEWSQESTNHVDSYPTGTSISVCPKWNTLPSPPWLNEWYWNEKSGDSPTLFPLPPIGCYVAVILLPTFSLCPLALPPFSSFLIQTISVPKQLLSCPHLTHIPWCNYINLSKMKIQSLKFKCLSRIQRPISIYSTLASVMPSFAPLSHAIHNNWTKPLAIYRMSHALSYLHSFP